MHTTQLTFRIRSKTATETQVADRIAALLFALERNGQIIPDTTRPLALLRNSVIAFVLAPEPNSLRRRLFNCHVRQAMSALADCLTPPIVKLLGRDPDSAAICDCRRSASLILSANVETAELPTTCGECGGIVPFYRFPHTDEFDCYDNLIFWARRYTTLDAIWLASGIGEMLAYRELSRVDSSLNSAGRGIARRIETLSGIPVYYYLYRHIGRRVSDEKKRRCPGCGKNWLLPDPWHKKYDFRCKRCRLISNIAYDAT